MLASAFILGLLGSFHCVGMCGPIAFMPPVDRTNAYKKLSQIIIGVLMIVFVLIPQKTLNKYNFSKPIYKLISKVKSALGKALKKKTADTFLTIGFLNGFLPCGLVYMAVLAAIAGGNALNGSLYMAVFGLGTIPLMTTAIYFSQFLKGAIRQKIQKAIPVFVVIIGLLFIIRGLGLGIPYLSPAPIYDLVSSGVDCH